MTENTKKPMPKKWTPEEEKKLLDLVKHEKSNEEIATTLGRSVGAQTIRRNMIAVRLSKEGKCICEVCDTCGITEEELEKQLAFDKKKKDKPSLTSSKSKTSQGGGSSEKIQEMKDIVSRLTQLINEL